MIKTINYHTKYKAKLKDHRWYSMSQFRLKKEVNQAMSRDADSSGMLLDDIGRVRTSGENNKIDLWS